MDINNLAFFKAVTTKLNWLDQRQKILAANVANADTPNYQSRDLRQISFANTLQSSQSGQSGGELGMAQTSSRHLAGGVAGADQIDPKFSIAKQKYESTPVRNGVILEEELIKVTETASNYKLDASKNLVFLGVF